VHCVSSNFSDICIQYELESRFLVRFTEERLVG